MKFRLFLLSALFTALTFSQPVHHKFMAGQIVVEERAGADSEAVAAAIAQHGGRTLRSLPRLGQHIVRVPEGKEEEMIHRLLATGLFSVAERDGVAEMMNTPNDPLYSSQWYLATIQAPLAWNTTTGSSTPIAIIDSGAYTSHQDLAARLAGGWNFVANSSNINDDFGHGTAVSGTIGAIANNGFGTVGVTWQNPLMALVVVDSTGYATYSNMAAAIQYAADHGARIINMSLGGTTSSSTLQSAVNYAWSKGSVVFAAAGNSGDSTPYYPAACTNVVAVSATEPNDVIAGFSTYGADIDLSAPGDNILTTQGAGQYGSWAGTSFASPIAAGVGALVLAVQPGLSASGLVSLLESNSDDLGAPGWDQYYGYGRVNASRAVAAAQAAGPTPTPPAVTIGAPSANSSVTGSVTVTGTVADSSSITGLALYVDGNMSSSTGGSNSFNFSWNAGSATAGSHTLMVTASDSNGLSGSSSVAVTVPSSAPPKDTTPPTVQITSPSNGSRVPANGNVTIKVNATDNVGVTQVSIYVDGTQICRSTAAPYQCNWNGKKAYSGTHVIAANAWDAAGNVGSATPINVTK